MSRRMHGKSVSWDDNDEVYSAPSYPATSESQRSDSLDGTGNGLYMENSIHSDPLYVYGLPHDDDASEVSFIIDEDDKLFRVGEGQWDAVGGVKPRYRIDGSSDNTEAFPLYMEDGVSPENPSDDTSDHGSADWDSHQSLSDDIDDKTSEPSGNPVGALFGDRPWRSVTPLNLVEEIMDVVNVNLSYDLSELGSRSDSLQNICDYEAPACTSAMARDILPEHEKIIIDIATDFITMTPENFKSKLEHDLENTGGSTNGGKRAKRYRTLQLYRPSNTKFDKLEKSWKGWQYRIEYMQITLISLINTRATLIEAGKKLFACHATATEEHEEWRPDPIPVKSQHGKAHFVVNTTYDPKTGKHALPSSMLKSSRAHDQRLVKQVEESNAKWEKLEKDFENVMLPLRYAQLQLQNFQLKLEYALARSIAVLHLAMCEHERLENEWIQSIFGQGDGPSLPMTEVREKENSPEASEFEDLMPSPVFRPTLDWMPKVHTTPDDIFNVGEFFCLNSGGEVESFQRCPRSDVNTSTASSELPSIHSSPSRRLKHSSLHHSSDTTATSVDEAVDVQFDETTASESTGLFIHPSHVGKGKLVDSERKKTAHERLTEVIAKHDAMVAIEAKTEKKTLSDDERLDQATKSARLLDELVARHKAESAAREEKLEADARAAYRLRQFGLIDFENIRRIHRDIMVSLSSHTDERSRLGQVIRHLMDCQLCWCEAGNRRCVRCERLNLAYHFGVGGEKGYAVKYGADDKQRTAMWEEKVEPCEYLGRRYCVADGDCELTCKNLAQRMGLMVDVKGKGKAKQHVV